MEEKDIQQLIERFMAGRTSIDEEGLLAEYFRTHDVPEKWSGYKDMFAWFDEGMPLDGLNGKDETGARHELNIKTETGTRPTDARRLNGNSPTKGKIHLKALSLIAAAAAAALLIIIAWPNNEQPITADSKPEPYATTDNVTTAKADTLANDTTNTAMPKKSSRKRGIRRDRYKPMSPKVYLAETQPDSTTQEVEMLAEEKIKETEKQQDEILKDVYDNYKRIEENLEIYLTALESYDVEEEYY